MCCGVTRAESGVGFVIVVIIPGLSRAAFFAWVALCEALFPRVTLSVTAWFVLVIANVFWVRARAMRVVVFRKNVATVMVMGVISRDEAALFGSVTHAFLTLAVSFEDHLPVIVARRAYRASGVTFRLSWATTVPSFFTRANLVVGPGRVSRNVLAAFVAAFVLIRVGLPVVRCAELLISGWRLAFAVAVTLTPFDFRVFIIVAAVLSWVTAYFQHGLERPKCLNRVIVVLVLANKSVKSRQVHFTDSLLEAISK